MLRDKRLNKKQREISEIDKCQTESSVCATMCTVASMQKFQFHKCICWGKLIIFSDEHEMHMTETDNVTLKGY